MSTNLKSQMSSLNFVVEIITDFITRNEKVKLVKKIIAGPLRVSEMKIFAAVLSALGLSAKSVKRTELVRGCRSSSSSGHCLVVLNKHPSVWENVSGRLSGGI